MKETQNQVCQDEINTERQFAAQGISLANTYSAADSVCFNSQKNAIGVLNAEGQNTSSFIQNNNKNHSFGDAFNQAFNPAYAALTGYYNEYQCADNPSCSNWSMAVDAFQGTAGLVSTGCTAFGGAKLVSAGLSRLAGAGAEEQGLALSGRLQTESSFGDKAIQNALNVPEEPGYFDVIGHGTPTDVSGLSPSELAARIESNPGWGGQNVRLLSCSTGCPTGTYAQELSNDLGVTVQAPTTDFYVSSRGGITFEPGGGWAYFPPKG